MSQVCIWLQPGRAVWPDPQHTGCRCDLDTIKLIFVPGVAPLGLAYAYPWFSSSIESCASSHAVSRWWRLVPQVLADISLDFFSICRMLQKLWGDISLHEALSGQVDGGRWNQKSDGEKSWAASKRIKQMVWKNRAAAIMGRRQYPHSTLSRQSPPP